MAAISIGRALGSGFGLIRRRPVSVFVWGLILVLLIQAPALVVVSRIWADMLGVIALGRTAAPQAILGLQSSLQGRMAIVQALLLPTFLIRMVIVAAVYRAVLEPKSSAFAYLRFGAREGWMSLLAICMSVVAPYVIVFALIFIGAVIAAAFQLQMAWRLGAWAVAAILTALLVWALLRLSLAAPLTFAERKFRLFESWAVTRGQALRLLVLSLAVFLIIVALEVLLFGGVAAVVWFSGVAHSIGPGSIRNWLLQLQTGQGIADVAPWLGAGAIVEAAVGGALTAIATAPFASAFRDLRPPAAHAAA
jgi:hypothetical protein